MVASKAKPLWPRYGTPVWPPYATAPIATATEKPSDLKPYRDPESSHVT